jgi:hypothetical protein
MRANLMNEAAIGDPLGLAAIARRQGLPELLDLAVLTAARRRKPDRAGDH